MNGEEIKEVSKMKFNEILEYLLKYADLRNRSSRISSGIVRNTQMGLIKVWPKYRYLIRSEPAKRPPGENKPTILRLKADGDLSRSYQQDSLKVQSEHLRSTCKRQNKTNTPDY